MKEQPKISLEELVFIRRPQPFRGTFNTDKERKDFLRNAEKNTYITFDDLCSENDFNHVFTLASRIIDFYESENPLSAIEAITMSYNLGVYPPGPILDWINKAFWKFHKGDAGKQYSGSFNKLLGLVRPGKYTPIDSELIRHRDAYIYSIMGILKGIFNLTVSEAALLVLYRESHLKNHESVGLPDTKSIEDGYNKTDPRPHFDLNFKKDFFSSTERVKSFIKSFEVPEAQQDKIYQHAIKKMKKRFNSPS